jgi:hypothetical protein
LLPLEPAAEEESEDSTNSFFSNCMNFKVLEIMICRCQK